MRGQGVVAGLCLAAWSACAALPSIDAGFYHSVALRSDGTVLTWGDDSFGQLGMGTPIVSLVPIRVQNAAGISAVAAGPGYNLAVKSNGTAMSWGSNTWGQLGIGSTIGRSLPTPITNLQGVVAMATGVDHGHALTNDGSVWSWGDNSRGALGTGGSNSTVPVKVTGLTDVVAIASGFLHVLALKRDGTVWAWGENQSGEVGNGTTTKQATPVQVQGLTGVVAISCGTSHSLALRQDGTVWIWGYDGVNRLVPGQVAGLAGIVSISAGGYHSLAIDGSRRAWQRTSGASPTLVQGLDNVKSVAAGYQHSNALRYDGTVWTWGANNAGQLGNGTTTSMSVPTAVAGLSGVTAISSGYGSDHTLALAADGTLWAWGDNGRGQLGQDSITFRTAPTVVPGLTNVVAVAAGHFNTFAVRQDGTLWGWGAGGTLGLGTSDGQPSPVRVTALDNVVAVSSGYGVQMALKSDKTVWSWGILPGDGTSVARNTPARVQGVPNITAIAAGASASYALDETGAVWAWGGNGSGAIGDGTTTDRLSPIKIPGLTNVVAIGAGFGHGGALKADGTVWTWGFNGNAELGDGTNTNRHSPVQVQGLPGNIVAISIGNGQSGAITSTGALWMWGGNWVGQVGDGTFVHRPVAVAIAGVTGIAGLAPGGFHSIALRADGSVYSWGKNDTGQLGDGTYVGHPSPAPSVAPGGAGSLDANNWFLDLDPAVASTIPAQFVPKALAVAQLYSSGALDATVKYKASELGSPVKNYVFALVPPAFFSLVKTVPGAEATAKARAKAGEEFVLAQLTAGGWATVDGQLLAYSSGVASAAGGAASILSGVAPALLPGSRFCVGYESAQSVLGAQSIREVLRVEGAETTSSGVPCFLQGVYLEGASSSLLGSPVSFKASVVGLSPTGTVQFRDNGGNLQAPVTLALANEAVAQASIGTSSLALGTHAIDAAYSGDGQNGARTTDKPLSHEVKSGTSGSSSIQVSAPASSQQGAVVVLTAVVTGNNPTGTVQFRDGASALGAPRPMVAGVAALGIDSLAVGTHSISASYSGDGSNSASTSNAVSHTVTSLGSGVILSSSANPAAPGFPVVLTAQVSGNNPGGSVVFRAGSTDLATVPLVAGVAGTTVANLPAGNHLLVAAYSGDGNNPAAISASLVQQIVAPTGGLAPNPFAFAARGNVPPSSDVTSSAITVTGIGAPVPILVSGGTYSIGCAGPYVSLSGIVAAGQTVCVRHTSPAAHGAATTTTLTIGGVSATFSSTTYTAAFQAAVTTLAARYYNAILRRAPDAGGQAFWSGEALRVAGLGANVAEAFYAMAMSFFTSAEYLAFNRDNSGFVTDLYTTFFSRAPDAAGLAYWQGLVDQGMPREVALAAFMFSQEFANLMQATFGTTTARAEVDAAMDFYRGLLVRLPDDGGFNFWVGRFRAAQCQGQAAVVAEVEAISSAFALSPEYLGRNRTSAQYVGDLYNAFLRRGGDLGGVQFWIGQVSSGARTREQVRAEFKNSPEFQARVAAIIAQGCL